MAIENPALPRDSIVVVTGANGFVGSHIADKFLSFGYRVRGTVRSLEKSAWMTPCFEKKHGKGRFEVWHVPAMEAPDAFAGVVKGAAAFIHTASPTVLHLRSKADLPNAVDGALNAMRAAYAEGSVRRVVLTSSSSAVITNTKGRDPVELTTDTWNEDTVKRVSDAAEPGLEDVYAASKTLAEQAAWKWYEEHKVERPDIVFNAVVPNMNMGKPVDFEGQGYASSGFIAPILFMNIVRPEFSMFPPEQYIDVQDTALLHVAAAISPDVAGERIFGFAGPYSFDKIVSILREQNPGRELPAPFSDGQDDNIIVPRARGEEILKSVKGAGWTSLEDTIAMNVEDVIKAGDAFKMEIPTIEGM